MRAGCVIDGHRCLVNSLVSLYSRYRGGDEVIHHFGAPQAALSVHRPAHRVGEPFLALFQRTNSVCFPPKTFVGSTMESFRTPPIKTVWR